MFSLEGKNALIIGGTSGIGREIALKYAEAGARIFPVSRNKEKVKKVVDEINLLTNKDLTVGFTLDAKNIKDLRDLVKNIIDKYKKIDILVNSRGTTLIKPAEDFNEEDFGLIIETNLKSVYFSCLEVGRHMIENGRGTIINIASMAAYRGWRNSSIYAISKAGVVSLTKTLGAEWAPKGVRVNGIAPGQFMTELNINKMDPSRKNSVLQRTPIGRFGELKELTGAALLLASDSSSFIVGETIVIDGGFLATGL